MKNSFGLLGLTPLWHVAQWVSRAPPHNTLPAFLNLNGSKYFKLLVSSAEVWAEKKLLKAAHPKLYKLPDSSRLWQAWLTRLPGQISAHFGIIDVGKNVTSGVLSNSIRSQFIWSFNKKKYKI